MRTWTTLVGSLRKDSWNGRLAAALAERAPDGLRLEVHTLAGIPVYDGDLEGSAFPDAVTALQRAIAAGDGVLLVSPEYNFGVPGPLKNAVDWTSRGPLGRCWKGKPAALAGASTGPSGTRSAQFAWWPVLRVLGTRIHPAALGVPQIEREWADGRPSADLERRMAAFLATL